MSSQAYSNVVKLRNIFDVKTFGAKGDGVTNDTFAIQAAATFVSGIGGTLHFPDGDYLIDQQINFTGANIAVQLSNGAGIIYNTPTYIAFRFTGANCSVSGGLGRGFVGPATWDGANVTPTYAVIIFEGNNSIASTCLQNIRKVGIWFKNVLDGSVEGSLIEGNYPSASFTGIEVGHIGVLFDTSLANAGNFKMNNNTIKSCVQGCLPANYGPGGITQGFVATGNIFDGCFNHGIYSNFTNGAVITGNTFVRCQIPVVISGDHNTVSGNSMFTHVDTLGDQRDVIGISVRDGSYNVISGNTLKGVMDFPSNTTAINVQDVSGLSDLVGNIISNNTIDITDGIGLAIRIVGNSKTCSGNIISGNVVRANGRTTEGVIGIYGPSGNTGEGITAITKANPGVITTTSDHGLAVDELISVIDVQGMTQINGTYRVNSTPSNNTLTVKSVSTGTPINTSAFGTYSSGGVVRRKSIQNVGNKISNNVIVAKAQTAGIYLINQTAATVAGNTIEWEYSAGASVNMSGVLVFDSNNLSALNNAFVIRPGYGTNVTIQGFRETGGTVTVQAANNSCIGNINQIDTTLGAVYQAIESLSGSELVADVTSPFTPTLPCSVGSIWRKTNGDLNDTFYVKQFGTDGSGWTAVGIGTVNVSSADIAAIGSSINTQSKFAGKLAWDTTNSRMMRAVGPLAGDVWWVVDGSASVTPS